MSTAPVPVFSLTLTPWLLAPPLAPLPSLVQGSLHFPETQLSSPDTLFRRSALCVTRQLWHHRKPAVRSLCSPPLSWQRGSCLLQSTSEGDCPCAWREDRQKRRHGNACSGPEDMENSIGCSAGWRGRETPEGSEGEKQCCTHSLAVSGPQALHAWASGTRPCCGPRTWLLRSWELVGQHPRKHPWVEPAFLGPPQSQGLLQPAPSCPVRRRARHRGWPQSCSEPP